MQEMRTKKSSGLLNFAKSEGLFFRSGVVILFASAVEESSNFVPEWFGMMPCSAMVPEFGPHDLAWKGTFVAVLRLSRRNLDS